MKEQYNFEVWEESLNEKSSEVYVFIKVKDQNDNTYIFATYDGESHNALRVRCSKRMNKCDRKKHAIHHAKQLIYKECENSK